MLTYNDRGLAVSGDHTHYWSATRSEVADLSESAYKYYLFDRWDSSGYVTGDKDINAVFDSCEYVQNYFKGKDISTMRPVEIYAMTKLAKEQEVVSEKDSISFDMGTDYTFEDIKEKTLISQETVFTGSNYVVYKSYL